MDDNDILLTNQFIPQPTIDDTPNEFTEDFKRYYKQHQEQEDVERTQKVLNEGTDVGNLLNTNYFENNKTVNEHTDTQRKTKEIKTQDINQERKKERKQEG